MGACLSKKSTCSSCPAAAPKPPNQIKPSPITHSEKTKQLEEEPGKKEIFIIKHRKSHDVERRSDEESGDGKNKNKSTTQEDSESGEVGSANNNNGGGIFVAATVRTSSCTMEEMDAILIQCGRLSRSSSTGKANFSGSCGSGENNNGSSQKGRKYSGSKRSYDFDSENGNEGRDSEKNAGLDDDNGGDGESSHRHRQRHRQSRVAGSPSKGRRRTPSREREQQQQQGPRSGSRERGGGNGSNGSGRRVSRSPGRRSVSPVTTPCGASAGGNSSSSGNCNTGNVRPGKMVSVPATVSSSSLAMDKSNNNGGGGGAENISASAVKRIHVKRNAGADAAATRTVASPRSRSPARPNIKVLNENQQQQQPGSLSRSNSRKAGHSPFRRNPLSEIDNNVVVSEQPTLPGTKVPNNVVSQGAENKTCKAIAENSLTNAKEEQQQSITENLAVNVVASGPECLKPQAVTRNRSSRLSRDFDMNPETLSNNSPSYTALLLEDIQNFHQKSSTPAISLPACLSKACSILEAVADLNSSTGSNLSGVFSEEKRRIPTVEQFNKYYDNTSFGATPTTVKGLETKDPFVQSEVVGSDDIMKPSFHKYVTTRRGTTDGEDMEEQESSGSNSFVAGQQYWVSPSSWEPNSADSTDRWTSSRSNTREENQSPLEFQRHAISESGHDAEEAGKRLNGRKKRESDQQQNGIGRGRIGSRGIHSLNTVAAAAAAST